MIGTYPVGTSSVGAYIQASVYNPDDDVAPGPRLLVVASELRGYDMAIEVRQYSTEDA